MVFAISSKNYKTHAFGLRQSNRYNNGRIKRLSKLTGKDESNSANAAYCIKRLTPY